MIDYLSLRPVRIETPTLIYTRHRLLLDGGVAQIRDHRDVPLQTVGTTTAVLSGEQEWTIGTEDGSWLVTRAGGCNCRSPQILPR